MFRKALNDCLVSPSSLRIVLDNLRRKSQAEEGIRNKRTIPIFINELAIKIHCLLEVSSSLFQISFTLFLLTLCLKALGHSKKRFVTGKTDSLGNVAVCFQVYLVLFSRFFILTIFEKQRGNRQLGTPLKLLVFYVFD